MAVESRTRRAFTPGGSFTIALTAALVMLLAPGTASMQARKPYEKDTLLKVIELNALPTQEITDKIAERGVAFKMTTDVDGEFRRVGARPEVLDAIRSNYRPASPPPVTTTTTTGGSSEATRPKSDPGSSVKSSINVPAGPPLSKDQIVAMLQSGAPPDRVERFVEVRGVSFPLTKEAAREITSAGGTRALLGAISEKAPGGEVGTSTRQPEPVRQPAVNRGPSYEELTDQAVAALGAKNPAYATNLLQQAIRVDPNQPGAYQLLGWSVLYNNRDVNSAERFMRAAIEHNGSAAFQVYHDHDGLFKTYCIGSFFVSKAGVSFRANDGNHTFSAEKGVIKEARTNAMVGAQWGAFHIKVNMANGHSQNFNFVPATYQIAESNLLLALLKSY